MILIFALYINDNQRQHQYHNDYYILHNYHYFHHCHHYHHSISGGGGGDVDNIDSDNSFAGHQLLCLPPLPYTMLRSRSALVSAVLIMNCGVCLQLV
jgi:hypothetical protein